MPVWNNDLPLMDNSVPMTDASNTIPTSHAASTVDSQILAIANSKTAVRFWDAGTFKNGTPNTGDMIVVTDVTTIASGGNAVFNLTSDHTSSGTALCSAILVNSVRGGWVDSSGNYNQGQPTVAGNLKTVTVPSTKQTATGIVVATITVIGSVTYPVSPNGTTVTLFAIGIAA